MTWWSVDAVDCRICHTDRQAPPRMVLLGRTEVYGDPILWCNACGGYMSQPLEEPLSDSSWHVSAVKIAASPEDEFPGMKRK